jgi:hypothetical protein
MMLQPRGVAPGRVGLAMTLHPRGVASGRVGLAMMLQPRRRASGFWVAGVLVLVGMLKVGFGVCVKLEKYYL